MNGHSPQWTPVVQLSPLNRLRTVLRIYMAMNFLCHLAYKLNLKTALKGQNYK